MTAGAQPGNQFGLKLKDPEVRQRAYKAYCDWLAKGKTKKSFVYEEDDLSATWATIDNYLKLFPDEFDSSKKEAAYAKGCAYWESVVDATAIGQNKEASVPTLNMLMRNKYKWDTVEHTEDKESTRADLSRFHGGMKQGRAEYIAKRSEGCSSEQEDTSLPSGD